MAQSLVKRDSYGRLLVVITLVLLVVLSNNLTLVEGESSQNIDPTPDDLGYTTQNGTVLKFTRIENAGLTRKYPHSYSEDNRDLEFQFAAGLATGDVDDDGDVDLYIVGGNTIPNALYLNNGNGTFAEVAEELGVDVIHWGSGPVFGDIDSDGDLDLFVGAVEHDPIYLFENRLGDTEGKFIDITADTGVSLHAKNTVSATMSDYDRDGWVDIFLTHWGEVRSELADTETVWRNEGGGLFSNASNNAYISNSILDLSADWSYTANLFDIDNDDDHDLLLASDFNTSQVLKNYDGKNFYRTTNRQVIKDQAGMGAAVGDYDNDGDFDWFVSSIYDLPLGGNWFGNRLYENDGVGNFTDVTLLAQVEAGSWGWGACTQDFDRDGFLDIFHVNGWFELPKYRNVSSKFFLNQGDGTFQSIALDVGIDDTEQGRALACFDADRDGDIDIIVVNVSERHIVYYRNDSEELGNYLIIKLRGAGLNTYGVGAKVKVTTTHGTQIRQLGGSNNYASHDPLEVHFGLGNAIQADIRVEWPDRDSSATELTVTEVNQILTISQPGRSGLRLSVQFGDGDGLYSVGDVVEISAAEPKDGYYFSHWVVVSDGVITNRYAADTTFEMPDSVATVTAYFLPGVAPSAEVSVARRWNEVLLAAIRNDFARPTVHARNLFHVSAAQYDAWVTLVRSLDPAPKAWLVGATEPIACPLEDLSAFEFDESDIETALSYASFRLIRYRFSTSPGQAQIIRDTQALMSFLDLDSAHLSTDYTTGDARALGNYIASCYLAFGEQDGANEEDDYQNMRYLPVNPALEPHLPGNPDIVDLNRWQPLKLESFIDQAGNPLEEPPEFLSPEWGSVHSFALSATDLSEYSRVGEEYVYHVYHDPGAPPTIDGLLADEYQWSHSLVSVWSGHLDPTVGRGADLIDISPNGIGNIAAEQYPLTFPKHRNFFTDEGLDPGTGYTENPVTGAPYEPQVVPLGDYARVLAEFWADGPDSETPPGHWFVILNTVNEHPDSTRKLRGVGNDRTELEWDLISYFVLGGTMHDAAITAWGIKGWYDYVRPISSIRAMADLGQSSNIFLPSYHESGIPLKPGYIELVDEEDALAGDEGEHVGKIKLFAWRGPDYIENPITDVAGVGWILAENWWPYQRPTFVTPPFAGYVSGHSTYSRAAAETLSALTGSAYFPGGMSDFAVEQDDFLVFERGPSVSLTLQWATYQDASDQCSLSRIWGGIHPPIDDIPGRLIGIKIGQRAFEHAMSFVEPIEN